MAKTSKVAANDRRRLVVARYAERRAALKQAVRTGTDVVDDLFAGLR